jgi:hypothetical protein
MQYKPGETVPTSGIYNVIHDRSHSQSHQVTAVRGEHFPPCRGCGHGVRYSIASAAHHLKDHPSL